MEIPPIPPRFDMQGSMGASGPYYEYCTNEYKDAFPYLHEIVIGANGWAKYDNPKDLFLGEEDLAKAYAAINDFSKKEEGKLEKYFENPSLPQGAVNAWHEFQASFKELKSVLNKVIKGWKDNHVFDKTGQKYAREFQAAAQKAYDCFAATADEDNWQ